MKRRSSPSKRTALRLVARRSGVGEAGTRNPRRPTPGWKGLSSVRIGWRNPRTPAVPATLDLTLEEYFTATSLMGILASQVDEPDPKWCRDWSFRMGRTMAAEARRRRRQRIS
jgi:hypothetical protein